MAQNNGHDWSHVGKIPFKFAEDAESYGGKRKRYVPVSTRRKKSEQKNDDINIL